MPAFPFVWFRKTQSPPKGLEQVKVVSIAHWRHLSLRSKDEHETRVQNVSFFPWHLDVDVLNNVGYIYQKYWDKYS